MFTCSSGVACRRLRCKKLIAQRDSYESRVNEVLAELAAEGLIAADVKLFRLFLLGALNWTVQWYNPGGTLRARDIAERYLTFVMRE